MQLKLDVVEIVVADMAASLAFYRLLGLDIPADADAEPHVQVPCPGASPWLGHRRHHHLVHPDWTPRSGSARMSLAFDVRHPRRGRRRLRRAHRRPGPPATWSRGTPSGAALRTLHDPDGNGVDLFAPLA